MPNEEILLEDELATALGRDLPAWRCKGDVILRTIRTDGWKSSLLLANAIGHLAELAWHHPDLLVRFGSVEIRLTTHSAGGITAKDLALAAKIDTLADWRPGSEDGGLTGIPEGSRHRYLKEPGA